MRMFITNLLNLIVQDLNAINQNVDLLSFEGLEQLNQLRNSMVGLQKDIKENYPFCSLLMNDSQLMRSKISSVFLPDLVLKITRIAHSFLQNLSSATYLQKTTEFAEPFFSLIDSLKSCENKLYLYPENISVGKCKTDLQQIYQAVLQNYTLIDSLCMKKKRSMCFP